MSWRRLAALGFGLALTMGTAAGAAEPGEGISPPVELAPGHPAEGDLAGGEERVFLVNLTAGRTWRVAVDQEGVDLVLTLEPPGGGSETMVNGPLGRYGPEVLVTIPATSGLHLLRLRPALTLAARGRFRIEVGELTGGGQRDRLRRLAERAFSEGGARCAVDTPESGRQAADAYQRAHDLWRSLDDRHGQAVALSALGALARRLDDPRLALERLGQALPLWRAEGDRRRTAITLNDLGLNDLDLGERAAAERHLTEAAELQAAIGDSYGEAVARNNLCLLRLSAGDPESARPCFERVVELFAAAGEGQGEALARNSLAGVFDQLGEPKPALEELERAYLLVTAVGDRRGQARLLANRAALYRRLGEPWSALADYGRAIPVLRELGDRSWLARALNNVGFSYLELGEPERARGLLEQALALRLEVGDRAGEVVTRNNLGRAHRQLGEPASAVSAHRKALELLRELDDPRRLATTHSLLGRALLDLGDSRQALASFEHARELLGTTGEQRRRGEVLTLLAWAHLRLGDAREALRRADEALALYRSVHDQTGEVLALVAASQAHFALGRHEPALAMVDQALAYVEALRQRVAGPQLRATFLDSRHYAYELKVEILMDRHRADATGGFAGLALAVAERSRARVLRDLLEATGGRLGLDSELSIRRRDLLRRLRAQAERRQTLLEAGQSLAAAAAGREVDATFAALDLLEGEIDRSRPGFADLTGGRPFDLARTQAELGDAMLLEFALGEERSYLWVVTAAELEALVLPSRRRLEAAARAAHLELRTLTVGAASQHGAVRELADLLLGPVAHRLAGGGRLVVVPDGALHYVPFGALSLGDDQPLVVDHEVVHLPSAATLGALRRQTPAAGRSLSVAILADPVLGVDDPRLPGAGGARLPAGESADADLPRLLATRREAEAIAALAPRGSVDVVLGFDADCDALRAGRWRRHRILHLATHGVLDARYPELSGVLLSRFDSQGRRRDGFLGLHDLYDLRLEADLVVLSGCETAYGRELKGEGVVGLTRGFMYAGVPRVVATLWRVEDRVAAEWMAVFYRELLDRRQSPAAALRTAQLEIRRRRVWRDPFYWAAFVLVGDWRDLERDAR